MVEVGLSSRSHSTLDDLLTTLDNGLIGSERPELASLVNWNGGSGGVPIHRWFRYREAFSPNLITELGLGNRILDPFCGSGSIMVGAAQQRRSSVGIDVNPLAAFVARVKLSPLEPQAIGRVRRFLAGIEPALPTTTPWPLPALRIAHKVFEPEVCDTLMRVRSLIEAQDRQVRDYLMLAWLAILEDVGSYFKEGNGIKYRNRKRLRSGYVVRPEGEWQLQRFGPNQPEFVVATFRSKLQEMLDDLPSWDGGDWHRQVVIEGNSLEEMAQLEPDSFDSVVFSPPYANRFDYFESQKVELWFGGFVSRYSDMIALRKRSLRSHLGAALDRNGKAYAAIDALLDLMDPQSYAIRMRVPDLIRGYFADMEKILRFSRAVLSPGGKCHIVVGNSAYAGVIIPTDALIARLGLLAGFEHARIFPVRHLTVAPQQRSALEGRECHMRESVVVLS